MPASKPAPPNEMDELDAAAKDYFSEVSFDVDVPPETYFEELREWAEEDD